MPQPLEQAKRELFDQTGHGEGPPVAAPTPPGRRQRLPRPYEDPRVATVPADQAVKGSVGLTLQQVEADQRRNAAAAEETGQDQAKVQRERAAREHRRQALEVTEQNAAQDVGRMESRRGGLVAQLKDLAGAFLHDKGQVPTEGTTVVLAAVVALRDRFDAASVIAQRLEGLELDVAQCRVAHQAAAWERDNPAGDETTRQMWRTRIAYGNAGKEIPRTAGAFLLAEGLPANSDPTVAELAGEAAARALEGMAKAQRELTRIGR